MLPGHKVGPWLEWDLWDGPSPAGYCIFPGSPTSDTYMAARA